VFSVGRDIEPADAGVAQRFGDPSDPRRHGSQSNLAVEGYIMGVWSVTRLPGRHVSRVRPAELGCEKVPVTSP
jgi:hypothetical protein